MYVGVEKNKKSILLQKNKIILYTVYSYGSFFSSSWGIRHTYYFVKYSISFCTRDQILFSKIKRDKKVKFQD